MISLAKAISENKDTEVALMLPNSHPLNMSKTIKKNFPSNIPCYFFETPRLRNPKNIFMLTKILKKIKSYNPDLIHIQHNGHPYLFLIYPFLHQYPIIDTIHNPIPHFGEIKLRTKFNMFNSLRNSRHFIVHGKKMKERMARFYDLERDKIDVVSVGGDIQRYIGSLSVHKEKFDEVENTILFFGRIWEYKGLDYLIKSEPLISKKIPNVKIVIAGSGEDISKYTELIVNNINFKIKNKYISFEEINSLFQKCSVVVLPYIGASQSGVIPLAYSYGKPIITTNVGSLPEYIINGKTGILVPPRDEESLARAIILLLNNHRLRKKMGKNALEFYKNNLSWEKISKQTIKCYKKCL